MPTFDLDRYYTPTMVADVVASSANLLTPRSVLDSACGSGVLLEAAHLVFPKAQFVGIDRDKKAIKDLRRRRPAWTLVTGDALDPETWEFDRRDSATDIAVLNPPFSMGFAKGRVITVWNHELRCSVAMAHILVTLEYSTAKLVVAIVPESLAYSDLDKKGRQYLASRYKLEVLHNLRNSTFAGARANALVIRLRKRETVTTRVRREQFVPLPGIYITRGRLPVHEAKGSRKGIPFIHSTDLRGLKEEGKVTALRHVRAIDRGVIQGSVILLPRVGLPNRENARPVNLPCPAQLSDCVIGISARTKGHINALSKALVKRIAALTRIYRGTGARYVTIDRLAKYLSSVMK